MIRPRRAETIWAMNELEKLDTSIYHMGKKHGLLAPLSYWQATQERLEEVVNGCGPAALGELIPDKIWGLVITDACNIHDWCWSIADNLIEKRTYDTLFLWNMRTMINLYTQNLFLKKLRHLRARTYWYQVFINESYFKA